MRNRFVSVACAVAALCLCLGLMACGSGTAKGYTAGTYTGTGQGAGGNVTVTVTIDDAGKLYVASDGVTGESETTGIGGKEACLDGTYAEQINAAQSANIDGISGATLTSSGVRDAIEDALAQASK